MPLLRVECVDKPIPQHLQTRPAPADATSSIDTARSGTRRTHQR